MHDMIMEMTAAQLVVRIQETFLPQEKFKIFLHTNNVGVTAIEFCHENHKNGILFSKSLNQN